jgi:hypothetical protein
MPLQSASTCMHGLAMVDCSAAHTGWRCEAEVRRRRLAWAYLQGGTQRALTGRVRVAELLRRAAGRARQLHADAVGAGQQPRSNEAGHEPDGIVLPRPRGPVAVEQHLTTNKSNHDRSEESPRPHRQVSRKCEAVAARKCGGLRAALGGKNAEDGDVPLRSTWASRRCGW